MLKTLRQHRPGLARNDAVIAAGKQPSREHELIDISPAVDCSRVTTLFGRPYPVQFRNQGAIETWTQALGTLDVSRRGHFRMQPYGVGNQQRKLIFVAPVLVHAEQLQGEVPTPKSYRTGAGAITVA